MTCAGPAARVLRPRADRGRPGRRPDDDVRRLVRRGPRGRAVRAQRDGRRDRLAPTGSRRRGWCCSRASPTTGFVFFTNQASRKGAELAAEPRCALLFPWHPLERQVRVEGTATVLPDADVAAYFASPSARVPARRARLAPVAGGRVAGRARRRRTTRRSGPIPTRCRCPRSGAATGCGRRSWSSGRAGRAGCTTGSSTDATGGRGLAHRAARSLASRRMSLLERESALRGGGRLPRGRGRGGRPPGVRGRRGGRRQDGLRRRGGRARRAPSVSRGPGRLRRLGDAGAARPAARDAARPAGRRVARGRRPARGLHPALRGAARPGPAVPAGHRGRALGRRRDARPGAAPGAAGAPAARPGAGHLPRRGGRRPAPAAGAARRRRQRRGHPPHRPRPADPGRRTPPGRGGARRRPRRRRALPRDRGQLRST